MTISANSTISFGGQFFFKPPQSQTLCSFLSIIVAKIFLDALPSIEVWSTYEDLHFYKKWTLSPSAPNNSE